MFENIPLKTYVRTIPRKPGNRAAFPDFPYSFPKDAQKALDCEFLLDGKQKFVQLLPVSDFARENCLYLQIFMYLESRSEYFTKRANYNSYLILYTYEGSGILEYKGKTYHLTPGTGVLIDCRRPHHYRTENDLWTHCDIHFDGMTASRFYSIWERNGDVSFSLSVRSFQPMLEQLLYDYINFSMERELLVSNHINTFILTILRKRDKQNAAYEIPAHIREAIKNLEENYKNPVSLDELADTLGLSKYHFSREFKKYTGKTPKEYLIELRIDNAKFLLSNSEIPCYKVGILSGFSDFNNFVRLFKKRMEITPTEFRNQSKQ